MPLFMHPILQDDALRALVAFDSQSDSLRVYHDDDPVPSDLFATRASDIVTYGGTDLVFSNFQHLGGKEAAKKHVDLMQCIGDLKGFYISLQKLYDGTVGADAVVNCFTCPVVPGIAPDDVESAVSRTIQLCNIYEATVAAGYFAWITGRGTRACSPLFLTRCKTTSPDTYLVRSSWLPVEQSVSRTHPKPLMDTQKAVNWIF